MIWKGKPACENMSASFNKQQKYSVKLVYKEFTKEYKGVKKQMTQIQLEKYYNLKAKYQKTVAVWKTKRGAKAVGGWVKGVVGKKKKS